MKWSIQDAEAVDFVLGLAKPEKMASSAHTNFFQAKWNKFWSTCGYVGSKLRNQKIQLDPHLKPAVLELLGSLKPMKAIGVEKVRVGEARDGGYVMLDDFGGISGAYSIGIGPDVSWDYAIAERGIEVFQFDHTVQDTPTFHRLFHFEPVCLGSEAAENPRTKTLAALVGERSQPEQDLLLKVDIEDAEWDVFSTMDPELLSRFRQIVCEFHSFHRVAEPAWKECAARVFDHLTRYHQVIHLHRNGIVPLIVSDDLEFPAVMEVTFARKSSYQFCETEETFPSELDKCSSRFFTDGPLTFLQQL